MRTQPSARSGQGSGVDDMVENPQAWVRRSDGQEERKRGSEALKGWWKFARPVRAWRLEGRPRSRAGTAPVAHRHGPGPCGMSRSAPHARPASSLFSRDRPGLVHLPEHSDIDPGIDRRCLHGLMTQQGCVPSNGVTPGLRLVSGIPWLGLRRNGSTERFPRAVHGRGPLTGPSAGGQAVEIAALSHDVSPSSPRSSSQAAFLASRSARGLSGLMSLASTSRLI